MANWTTIPDDVLEPGKPIRSVDALALRDNPVAIAAGAANAPRVQTAAIQNAAVTTAKLATGERMTTANVLARTAGASPAAVGTYTVAFWPSVGNLGSVNAGSTIAGSSLTRSVFTRHTVGAMTAIVPSDTESAGFIGTWRLMASIRNNLNSVRHVGGLFLRIS